MNASLTEGSNYQSDQIYVTCQGEHPTDMEHIGPLALMPLTIPMYYFPFRDQKQYLSPFIMVQFLNPDPGVVLHVVCKAWAKNIVHNRVSQQGWTNFQVLVER